MDLLGPALSARLSAVWSSGLEGTLGSSLTARGEPEVPGSWAGGSSGSPSLLLSRTFIFKSFSSVASAAAGF